MSEAVSEMMQTCWEFAEERLKDKAIKDTTYVSYMTTLRVLGLQYVPYEWVNVKMVNDKLQRVLNPGTRRKHAINIRAALGLNVPCPRPAGNSADVPPIELLRESIDTSGYRMYGLSMLYAGMRLGEACVKQPQKGRALEINRQRRPDGAVTSSKTTGTVLIPQWFADEYEDWKPDLHPSSVYYGLRRAGKRHGFYLTPKMLRKAFATNLVEAGAKPEMLRRQMRHHHVSMSLEYYVQTDTEAFEDVITRFGDAS